MSSEVRNVTRRMFSSTSGTYRSPPPQATTWVLGPRPQLQGLGGVAGRPTMPPHLFPSSASSYHRMLVTLTILLITPGLSIGSPGWPTTLSPPNLNIPTLVASWVLSGPQLKATSWTPAPLPPGPFRGHSPPGLLLLIILGELKPLALPQWSPLGLGFNNPGVALLLPLPQSSSPLQTLHL